jgi:hypothetical protein
MTQKPFELPWTKREIIDAIISQYAPSEEKDPKPGRFTF